MASVYHEPGPPAILQPAVEKILRDRSPVGRQSAAPLGAVIDAVVIDACVFYADEIGEGIGNRFCGAIALKAAERRNPGAFAVAGLAGPGPAAP